MKRARPIVTRVFAPDEEAKVAALRLLMGRKATPSKAARASQEGFPEEEQPAMDKPKE